MLKFHPKLKYMRRQAEEEHLKRNLDFLNPHNVFTGFRKILKNSIKNLRVLGPWEMKGLSLIIENLFLYLFKILDSPQWSQNYPKNQIKVKKLPFTISIWCSVKDLNHPFTPFHSFPLISILSFYRFVILDFK